MPIYEYRCTQCQTVFERHQTVGAPAPACPACGGASRKLFASVGLIFKGSGFHTTDYRKTAGSADSPPSGPSAAPNASAARGASSDTSSDKS
jgi:putative FmdB family regulatory protein